MAYSKIVFTENVTTVGPTNLNHMEDGIFNAAATADAAIPKPSVPSSNDVLVWDSGTSSWKAMKLSDAMVSASAGIAASKISGYPSDSTKALRGDGSWTQTAKVTTSTLAGGPPASPADTDIWIATSVDANGTRWEFQYNAGSASAYKWECIGGPEIFATDDGTVTTVSAAYAVPTAGTGAQLSFAGIVRGGDYIVGHSGYMSSSAAAQNCDVGLRATGAADVNLARNGTGVANGNTPYGGEKRMNGVTAGGTIQPIVAVSGGTGTYAWRTLWIRPVRIA